MLFVYLLEGLGVVDLLGPLFELLGAGLGVALFCPVWEVAEAEP